MQKITDNLTVLSLALVMLIVVVSSIIGIFYNDVKTYEAMQYCINSGMQWVSGNCVK